MGNCIRQQQSSTSEDGIVSSSSSTNDKTTTTTTTTTEVKIKITKKQLEELLAKMDMKELRVDQVLVHLMDIAHNTSSGYNSLHHQPWKPVLQSIPEVN